MPYLYSEAQKKYLRRMHAEEAELERGCDCPGCDKCSGFVSGCKCDTDMDALRKARK